MLGNEWLVPGAGGVRSGLWRVCAGFRSCGPKRGRGRFGCGSRRCERVLRPGTAVSVRRAEDRTKAPGVLYKSGVWAPKRGVKLVPKGAGFCTKPVRRRPCAMRLTRRAPRQPVRGRGEIPAPRGAAPARCDGRQGGSGRLQLVLGAGVEIRCLVPFAQLFMRRAAGAVDHLSPLHGRPLEHLVGPADHVLVDPHVQKLSGVIAFAMHRASVPRPDRHVRDGIVVTRHIAPCGKVAVQHIQLDRNLAN